MGECENGVWVRLTRPCIIKGNIVVDVVVIRVLAVYR